MRARHARRVEAYLPSADGLAVPSLAYLAPLSYPLPSPDRIAITKQTLFALPLSFEESSKLFEKIAVADKNEGRLTSEVVVGDDLISLARIWRFAGNLISRRLVLPSIYNNRSRWIPVVLGTDATAAEALFGAVPASAYCIDDAELPKRFFEDVTDIRFRRCVATILNRKNAARERFYDLHSAWIASLRSNDSRIKWNSESEIRAFADILEKWREPVCGRKSDFSLAFRVVDPVNATVRNPKWILQPLIVNGERAEPFSRRFLDELSPYDRCSVLVALGQASSLIPGMPKDITRGVSADGSVSMDAPSLYAFLKEGAQELRAAGFKLYAPKWWGKGDGKIGRPKIRAVSIRPQGGSGLFTLDSLLDVKWEIVLGGKSYDAKEIEWMLASGSPILRDGDGFTVVDEKALIAARTKLNKLLSGPISLQELVTLGISSSVMGDVAVEVGNEAFSEEIRTSGFISLIDGIGKLERIAIPKGFHGKLRNYQRKGLDWMTFLFSWRLGACLADDMGLGKTIEAISIFLTARARGLREPILVVCPMSIMLKWSRELKSFAPKLRVWMYHGHDRARGAAFKREALQHDVCITSYQLLAAESASFEGVDWGIITVDEAQNIKNHKTAKSKTVRSLSARWRLALTGTPVENSVGDIWAIMDFLNPGLLADYGTFAERFQRPLSQGSDGRAGEELRQIVAPFILRRLKTDPEIVSALPDKVEEKVYCSLTREQAELYAAEVHDAERSLYEKSGIARHGAVLALLTRLKQICNHPMQYRYVEGIDKSATLLPDTSGKLKRLEEMLKEVIAANEASLIFTQYAVMGKLLAAHLTEKFGFEVPFLHGEVPMKKRDEMVARFQREDGPPIFILSIKTGGTGLDLTRANHVFHYDRWWNPAVENQATDRAHRIGQNKTVFVHTFICEGTLESHIDDLITGKLELAKRLITQGDSWLSDLDEAGLRKVIELSDDFKEDE